MSFTSKLTTGPASDAVAERVILGEAEKDEEWDCCGLSYKQRFIGYLICMLIGGFLSLLSIFGVFDVVLRPAKFAIIYSLANLTTIIGSLMMWGPKKQAKDMFSSLDRGIASVSYLSCIVGTILLCILYPKWYLLLPLVIIQFCAGIYYTLSFFPRIRKCLAGCCFRACCGESSDYV